jgi:hypothetical protein
MCLLLVSTKIARSGDLGIRKHNKSIEIIKKIGFNKLRSVWQGTRVSQTLFSLAMPMNSTHT